MNFLQMNRYTLLIISALLILVSCNQSLQTTFNSQETKINTSANSVAFSELEQTSKTPGSTISYTTSPVDTITPRQTLNEGATRLTFVEGDGDQLGENGTVTFYYAGYVFTTGPTKVSMMHLTMEDSDGVSHTSWLCSPPYSTFSVSGPSSTGAVISGSSSSSGLTFFGTNHYLTAQFVGWDLTEDEYEPMTVSLSDKTLIDGLRNGLVGVRAGEVCDIAFSGRYGLGKRPIGSVSANSALLYRVWVESVEN